MEINNGKMLKLLEKSKKACYTSYYVNNVAKR